MSRPEMYPWSLLTVPGDYFIVSDAVKPYPYISAMVSQRNYRLGGNRYAVARCNEGAMVILTRGDELPTPYDSELSPGIFIKKAIQSKAQVNLDDGDNPYKLRLTPQEPKLSQMEIISRMTPEEKQANLPWWYDPKTGKTLINGKVMDEEDADKYVGRREKLPGPNDPYPKKYNLDENLRRIPRHLVDDGDEEEDWGDEVVGEVSEDDAG